MRRDGTPFAERDGARIAAVVPHLGAALRAAALRATGLAAAGDGTTPAAAGVLIVDVDGNLLSATSTGRDLLDLLPIRDGAATPGVLRAVALTLRDRQPLEPARLRVPGRDGGWIYLEAAPLSGAGDRIAVTLQRAGRAELCPIALRAHGLTARESEVTMHVLRGESTRQIADRLSVSPWTVQDHLKAIFAKVGVRSRRDLAMQIFLSPDRPAPANAARRS
jgi:DNA-binding CsgD family transcriptional regulator